MHDRRHSRAFAPEATLPGRRQMPGIRLVMASVAVLFVSCACESEKGDKGKAETAPSPPVPSRLADGSAPLVLPRTLRSFRGLPVIGVKQLAGARRTQRSCPPNPSLSTDGVLGAWLSTDGLSVGYLVQGRSRLYTCDALRVSNRWASCAGAHSPFADARRVIAAGGGHNICALGQTKASFLWIQAIRDGWVLVNHGSYWSAYEARRKRLLRVSFPRVTAGSIRARIADISARGTVLSEREVRGAVAG